MANRNENQELAIKLIDVKKMYKLGQIGGGTLRADLQSWWAKKRGLEDPNTKIGEQRLIGQTFMALNGIDLEVYKGEALGIIGGNGAGKSTMLKLLSRVTAPTSGRIQIWGRVASMLEVGTGFNGEMTGRENIYMNGAILGMTKAEIDAKMEDIIEFSEVRDFIDTPVKRYSSGMYVKLAFSVAAHLDSEIMIMDEVLAVGDINFQQKCLKKMRDVAKTDGRTVLYVSHNMSTIRQLCDRCIVLDQGRIIFDGDVDQGIGIYGSHRENEVRDYYDVSKVKRSENFTEKCHINEVRLCKSILNMGEKLKLYVNVNSKIEMKQSFIRMMFKNESGNTVATAYSNLYALSIGDNDVECVLDITELTYGEYSISMVIGEYRDDIQYRHDGLGQIFFRIVENEYIYNYKWDRISWGYVRLKGFHAKNGTNG